MNPDVTPYKMLDISLSPKIAKFKKTQQHLILIRLCESSLKISTCPVL
jgi:hypothetical protein